MKIEKRVVVCMCIAFVSAFFLTGWLLAQRGLLVDAKAQETQENLAQEVLRFHVLANSDSEEDQEMKMQVKEAVLSYLEESMPREAEIEEIRQWVKWHLEDLEAVAVRTLREAGSTDTVTAELTKDYFPAKTYGDITFPAGEYEALRIKIGRAAGHNWWCCLYPQLCFTDAVNAVVTGESEQKLRNVLDEEDFSLLEGKKEVKFRLLEWAEKLFHG